MPKRKTYKARVLIVDDERLLRWSLVEKLRSWGYVPIEAATGREALQVLRSRIIDMIILDLRLPDIHGMRLLRQLREIDTYVPIIILTAYGSVEDAVEAMKAGANDFLTKPIEFAKLQVTLERLCENVRLRRRVQELEATTESLWTMDQIVAHSPAMQKVVHDVRKILEVGPETILITGESGTGKDFLARVIHNESARSDKPFVVVDCGALPASLIESELFGYERGAFTGANQSKKGAFALADGGTLVLDEIAEMRPDLQVKLLRVLEDRTFRPLGGTADISIDVMVIATSNRDLEESVRTGRFRQDLYFRLNVVRIHLPPLRERREDILPLARWFLQLFNTRFHRRTRGFTLAAEEALIRHDWPGNIRELRNTIERAMILNDVDWLDTPHLQLPAVQSAPDRLFQLPPEGIRLEELEKQLIFQALEMAGGNKTRAARLLGLTRDAFRYRLKRFLEEDATASVTTQDEA